ncbi:DNA-binding response regulator [Alteromonas sp. V450]|uniref:response regulator transcription factor n=1 Tax=Alteromonas sp. V450 TaxID=1912139 RepID=UPI0008FF2899|nr:response regulator transcription factor [Alteromonas sp. V450]OJF70242.1 DNA-binding response regulator [Alteromonas sp. V450]
MNLAVKECKTMSSDFHLQSILIIDDDIELTEMLSAYLTSMGYQVTVKNDGEAGLSEALSGNHYDLVLLDVMMPKLDGFDVLKKLRASHSTPVLMLTARGDDYDRILGLEMGADDYLPKPFNHRELVARIKAIVRRHNIATSGGAVEQDLRVENVHLSPSSQVAKIDDIPLTLTSTEFLILRLLMLHAGHRVTKEEISLKVLGKPLQAFDRSIDMHVSNLRKKIAEITINEKIKTIRGVGYMLMMSAAK